MARVSVRHPSYRAQLPTKVDRAPSGPGWLHELAYDGHRVGCLIASGKVRLESRGGADWTQRFPEVVAAARRLDVRQALLDGEVALVLPDGRTSVRALRNAAPAAARDGLTYFVFDLLYLDGESLLELPLEERKARCEKLLGSAPASRVLRYSPHLDADGTTVFERACELGASGIVSKRRGRPYRPGRNQDWLKTECGKRRHRAAPERSAREHSPAPVVAGIAITTPERPVYPELGFVKLDLARYYAEVAEHMLPYVANRPLTLVRCEKGVRGPDALRTDCKFLRHEPGWHRWAKEPLRRVNIQEQKKIGEYLLVDSPAALVALAQGDILEVHVWNAKADDLERPDRIVFDLDPGRAVTWASVVEAAHELRRALEALDLRSWVKLTGGKGLHVVVPFVAERAWQEVFSFARSVAGALVRLDPGLFPLEFGKHGRERRILVDYKRNHRAAVAVAAFSARARPGGAVSAPVAWRELEPSLAPDAYRVTNMTQRLTRLRMDPWKEFWASRQRLRAAAR